MLAIPTRLQKLVYPETADVAASRAQNDAMARNRARPHHRPAQLDADALPAEPLPMERDAFRDAQLHQAVADARLELARAKNAVMWGAKPDKPALRKAVGQANAALSRAEAAASAEARAEPLSPAVQRRDVGQGDVVLREARVAVAAGRAVLVHPLDTMCAKRDISRAQCAAGHRYRRAHEQAGRDLYPTGLGEQEGRSAPASGNRRVEDAAACSAALDRMRRIVGMQGANLLDHVAVQGLDVRGWANRQVTEKRTGMNPTLAMGLLHAALTLLVEDWAERREGGQA